MIDPTVTGQAMPNELETDTATIVSDIDAFVIALKAELAKIGDTFGLHHLDAAVDRVLNPVHQRIDIPVPVTEANADAHVDAAIGMTEVTNASQGTGTINVGTRSAADAGTTIHLAEEDESVF